MVVCGVFVLRREYNNQPLHLATGRWALILLGGATIVAAFAWDFRNTANGGVPNPFNWLLFIAGEAIAVGTFVTSLRRSPTAGRRPL